ncbi:GNAT family N-acetyltransferase [Gleimia hominis]|uniref:GNAT family N-acetyltransferase n=1 Tax=Gleimia hominis TaxID=595468 RepID=A0ABU3IAH0_9ACTO|nr:GNAT family N-acetyltransferase [Gleimia hominis]MDT3766507.1 GNAT family N-acetyltransferase [Gleimia hominis]
MPQTGLELKQADGKDVARTQRAYEEIKDFLASEVTYRHWHTENHPSEQDIQRWIERGQMFIALHHGAAELGARSSAAGSAADTNAGGQEPADAELVGVMALDQAVPQGYEAAPWLVDAAPSEVLAVHALGVVPGYQRRGVAKFLLDGALEVARELGCVTVRLDVLAQNTPGMKLYADYGFKDLGLFHVDYDTTDLHDFHLFEYVLDQPCKSEV